MQINLTELFSVEGKEKIYTAEIDRNTFQAPDGVWEIVSKEPVILRIRNLGGKKLLLEGKAVLSLSIPCSRCLEPVNVPFELDIFQELDMDVSEADRVEELDEQPYVSGYYLDVDQLIGNELLLNLPMKVLCREDCKGICNRCGMNLNRGSCSCDRSSPDPRMSAIQDIFQKFKEV
ncbi:MAG: DUF177 domain-containing protein [Lachnospiraceae bacterium]|jgi:uncharacterized protein|nr:DUF177 domain-containing protein [Lachnospiraceae bacterium]